MRWPRKRDIETADDHLARISARNHCLGSHLAVNCEFSLNDAFPRHVYVPIAIPRDHTPAWMSDLLTTIGIRYQIDHTLSNALNDDLWRGGMLYDNRPWPGLS